MDGIQQGPTGSEGQSNVLADLLSCRNQVLDVE